MMSFLRNFLVKFGGFFILKGLMGHFYQWKVTILLHLNWEKLNTVIIIRLPNLQFILIAIVRGYQVEKCWVKLDSSTRSGRFPSPSIEKSRMFLISLKTSSDFPFHLHSFQTNQNETKFKWNHGKRNLKNNNHKRTLNYSKLKSWNNKEISNSRLISILIFQKATKSLLPFFCSNNKIS